jgi:NADPH-dependent ferric siderophore reductase
MYAINLWIKCVKAKVCEVVAILEAIPQDMVDAFWYWHTGLC